jgi:hypothetical protein
LIKSYPATGASAPFVVDHGPCDGGPASVGWKLTTDGKLVAPSGAVAAVGNGDDNAAGTMCLGTQSGPTGQDTHGESSCPPPTTNFPSSGCGVLFTECSSAQGAWAHNTTSGLLRHSGSGSSPGFVAVSHLLCAGVSAVFLQYDWRSTRTAISQHERHTSNHAPRVSFRLIYLLIVISRDHNVSSPVSTMSHPPCPQ